MNLMMFSLKEIYGDISEDSWYLNIVTSSHLMGINTVFNFLDDTKNGVVSFGDGSTINYEGKGRIHVQCSDGNTLQLENVIYAP